MDMNIETARGIIAAHHQNKPSEIAKAVDIIYQELGTYQSITQEIGKSDKFWIVRHRIAQLPVGILWKIDEGDIGIEQAYQITRLKQEEDSMDVGDRNYRGERSQRQVVQSDSESCD